MPPSPSAVKFYAAAACLRACTIPEADTRPASFSAENLKPPSSGIFFRRKHEAFTARHFACRMRFFKATARIFRGHTPFSIQQLALSIKTLVGSFPAPTGGQKRPFFIYAKNARPPDKSRKRAVLFLS